MTVFATTSTDRPRSHKVKLKMSKIVLVLCLIIGSYTANAGFLDSINDQIKAVQNKITELINNAIQSVRNAVESAMATVGDWTDQAKKKIEELTKQVTDAVNDAIKEAEGTLQKWLDKAEEEGVDVTECQKIMTELRHTGANIIVNSTKCLTDRYEEGVYYIEDMQKIADEVYDNLNTINDEAGECFSNIKGLLDAYKALGCINSALAKAVSVVASQVPSAINNIMQLQGVIIKLIPGMTFCVGASGIGSISNDLNDIASQVLSCVQSKLDEQNPATETFLY